MFNGTVLEQVKHAKFLGVYIDEHLSWGYEVACKVSHNVGILGKLKHTAQCPSNMFVTSL